MKELEEAAREYASCDISEGGLTGLRGIEAGKYEPFIAGAQWQAKQSPWISVEERLPETNNGQSLCAVLVKTCDNGYSVTANICVEFEAERGYVTHWMPIPNI